MDSPQPPPMPQAVSAVSTHTTPLADQHPSTLIAGLTEIVVILAAAHEAHWLRFGHWAVPAFYFRTATALAILVVLLQSVLGAYGSWRGRSIVDQMLRVYASWIIALSLMAGAGFLLRASEEFSRLWVFYTVVIALAQVTALRLGWAGLLRVLREAGRNLKGVVVIESPRIRHSIHDKRRGLQRQGYQILRSIKLNDSPHWLEQLAARVAASGAHEVWLCLPIDEAPAVKPILHALRHLTVEIRFLPEWRSVSLLNYRVRSIAGLYAVDISCSRITGANRAVKRLEDLILGSLIGLLILPVCLLVALAVRVSSAGPVLFRQQRLGADGHPFQVYKFRTMTVHTEAGGRVTQAQPGDARVTRVGAFLRRTSLDELPQFLNVLRGDMSIVGPRPHAIAHNDYYKNQVTSYMKRHKVKPGITGWAQVKGYRGLTDTLEKMQHRVECDLWYINNWSLVLDLRIILWTIAKGFVNGQP